jgi:hypothetical protein
MIVVSQLCKKYGAKLAVSNLSFTVPDGQVTGFLGPNGSGKSTTIRCILGLDTPTKGTVTFDHSRFSRLNVGAVLDVGWCAPSRSGRNHLLAIAAGAGITSTRVDECLRLVGMTDAAKHKIGDYSLGMKQRLGVATALLGDPQHLIFDEPINGLDPEGVSWMRSVVRQLAEEGKAVLISSHLLSEMEKTADRIVVIGKGELIGEYRLEEFLADGITVWVESSDHLRLANCIDELGLHYRIESTNTSTNVVITVPAGESEKAVRMAVATKACKAGLPIYAMSSVRENLEQRFLAATATAQEYRTEARAAA